MPRGLAKIQQRAAEAAQRQADYDSGNSSFQRAFMLSNGETAQVRFLEEGVGVWYVYVHDLPMKAGKSIADKILCADQPYTDAEADVYVEGSRVCYACGLEGVKRRARVILNMIRFDEPKLVRDAQGKAVKDSAGNIKFDGVEPALVVWDAPQMVGGRLAYLESQKGGLTSHICSIHKTPEKTNPWMVDIAEADKLPPTQLEIDLNSKKIEPFKAIQNLSPKFRAIPLLSHGDMVRAYGGSMTSGFAPDSSGAQVTPENNIYAKAEEQKQSAGKLDLGAFSS